MGRGIGVEGQFGLTYDELNDLQADTGKRCLRALKVATNIVNRPYYQAAQASKAALDSLEPTVVEPTLTVSTSSRRAGHGPPRTC